MNIKKNLVLPSRYHIKCPYEMTPEFFVVHNTANDASAENEVAYMIRNDQKVSFHYAVDDIEVVQGVPENRNTWNAGDGGHGDGNRKGIAVEICYSLSGGERFIKAEQNAAAFIASRLFKRGWGVDRVKKHQDFNGKYCPHRTLNMGWKRFIDMVQSELDALKAPEAPESGEKSEQGKTLYRVQVGAYTKRANAEAMKKRVEKAGFEAYMVTIDGLYKIQVGAYAIKENAEAMYKRICKAGFDAFITSRGGKAVAAEPEPEKVLAVGSLVRVKKGASDWNGKGLASFVYERIHTVSQIDGNRVVITFQGVTIAAVHRNNLIMV